MYEVEPNTGKPLEIGPVPPPEGGTWLANIPTDHDDRFPEGSTSIDKWRETYPKDHIVARFESRDPSTGGYVRKHGVLGVWKFPKIKQP